MFPDLIIVILAFWARADASIKLTLSICAGFPKLTASVFRTVAIGDGVSVGWLRVKVLIF